jgi:hypothetical protein
MEPTSQICFRVGLFLLPESILFLQRPRAGELDGSRDRSMAGALIGLHIFWKAAAGKPDSGPPAAQGMTGSGNGTIQL